VLKQVSEASARPNWGFRAARPAFSPPTGDLFRWQQALFAGRILGAAARDKLLRGYVKLSHTEVAYGWFRSLTARGRLVLWTRGSEEFGHNAVIKVYPMVWARFGIIPPYMQNQDLPGSVADTLLVEFIRTTKPRASTWESSGYEARRSKLSRVDDAFSLPPLGSAAELCWRGQRLS